jgi:hypothetical protein
MKNSLIEENKKLNKLLKIKIHNQNVTKNIRKLGMNPFKAVQIPNQISSHIPQIVNLFKKKNQAVKMCGNYKKIAHYNLA